MVFPQTRTKYLFSEYRCYIKRCMEATTTAHPQSLIRNLKMLLSKRNLLFQWIFQVNHLEFQGCKWRKTESRNDQNVAKFGSLAKWIISWQFYYKILNLNVSAILGPGFPLLNSLPFWGWPTGHVNRWELVLAYYPQEMNHWSYKVGPEPIYMGWNNPHKWPNMNGFAWGYFNLLIGVLSPHLSGQFIINP